MDRLLIATDLSPRAECAVQRGRLLAQQFKPSVLVTHVVDDDQPTLLVEHQQRQAESALIAECSDLGSIRVMAGIPFLGICHAAQDHQADLILMGSHRRRVLLDVFTGTTVERVIRSGNVPVLMVNREPVQPYRCVVAAIDFSEESRLALVTAQALGLLEGAAVHAVHALVESAQGQMIYAGVDERTVRDYTAQRLGEAMGKLSAFLETPPLDRISLTPHAASGPPFDVIRNAVLQLQADLVIVGTRGLGGLKRVLLGSVADQILRTLECDVLAVPPPT